TLRWSHRLVGYLTGGQVRFGGLHDPVQHTLPGFDRIAVQAAVDTLRENVVLVRVGNVRTPELRLRVSDRDQGDKFILARPVRACHGEHVTDAFAHLVRSQV